MRNNEILLSRLQAYILPGITNILNEKQFTQLSFCGMICKKIVSIFNVPC